MKKYYLLIISFLIIISATGYSQVSVTFAVDMEKMALDNKFYPATEKVILSGVLNIEYVMTDKNEDSIYTVTVDALMPGSTIVFNYTISGNAGKSIERTYVVPANNSTISTVMGENYLSDTEAGKLSNSVGIASINKSYDLGQNYPNPFSKSTKIQYSVGVAGLVTLKVYDMSGKEVAVLVNEEQSKGVYTADFNAANLTDSAYVYTIFSGNFSSTRKMFLAK